MPILFQDKKTSLSKFKIGVPKSDQSLPAPLKKNITETVERRQELIRSGNNHSSIRYTFFVSLDFNLFVNIKQNYLLEKLFEFAIHRFKCAKYLSPNFKPFFSDRLPRGQTRKLASFFESMEKNAKVQMVLERDRLSSVRSKSVPTRNDFSLENRSSAVFFRKDAESKLVYNIVFPIYNSDKYGLFLQISSNHIKSSW